VIVYGFQSRENVRKLANQLWRKVLIEQYPHCSTTAVGGIRHVCGESIHGGEVFFLEAWMFLQNLPFRHTVGQPAENVIHSNPHPANAGSAVAFVSLERDARVRGRHASIIAHTSVTCEFHAPVGWPLGKSSLVAYKKLVA